MEMTEEAQQAKLGKLLIIWKRCEDALRLQSAVMNEEEISGQKRSAPVHFQAVYNLATKMALTEHAPKGWREELPLINALPPAPQPEQMRIGVLAEYNRQQETLPGLVLQKAANRTDAKVDYVEQVRARLQQLNAVAPSSSAAMDVEEIMSLSDALGSYDKGAAMTTGVPVEHIQQQQQRRSNVNFGAWADDSDDDS